MYEFLKVSLQKTQAEERLLPPLLTPGEPRYRLHDLRLEVRVGLIAPSLGALLGINQANAASIMWALVPVAAVAERSYCTSVPVRVSGSRRRLREGNPCSFLSINWEVAMSRERWLAHRGPRVAAGLILLFAGIVLGGLGCSSSATKANKGMTAAPAEREVLTSEDRRGQ